MFSAIPQQNPWNPVHILENAEPIESTIELLVFVFAVGLFEGFCCVVGFVGAGAGTGVTLGAGVGVDVVLVSA
jgi:hypothetical protein